MNNNLAINQNRRVNPILGDTTRIRPETLQRVVEIALPFISLHAQGQLVVSLGIGSFQAWGHIAAAKKHYDHGNRLQTAQEAGQLIVVVSSVALSILFPVGQFVLSQTYVVATRCYSLAGHLYRLEGRAAIQDIAALAHTAIHAASMWYATPAWIVLSLLTQACVEFAQAYTSRDKLPEAAAKILLGCIRLYATKPHLYTLHRNHFGKKLTQAEWNQIAHENNLEEALIQKGISSYIENIDFSGRNFSENKFQNLWFSRCNFSNTVLHKTSISKVSFDSCLFKQSRWVETAVQHSFFRGCNFEDAALLSSWMNRVSVFDSNLSESCWNNSVLENVTFLRDKLTETSFLHVAAKHSSIVDSDLTDCLLLDTAFKLDRCTANVFTRPIIGLAWDFSMSGIFTPIIYSALKDNRAIVLRFEIPEHNALAVDAEVTQALQHISPNALSIPADILQRADANSEIGKIRARAESILKHCHGFAIPGGADIEPELYGAKREPETGTEDHYVHSMTEFALIAAAKKYGTPVMGTCRGSQLINIFFGGSLHQHVDGHWGEEQELQLMNPKYRELFGERMYALSMHHQAADRIGKGLDVVFAYDGIPKVMVSQDGQFLASQVHPEIYLDFKNYPKLMELIPELYDIMKQNQALYLYFLEKTRHFWTMKQTV